VEGPRLGTQAESHFLRQAGCHLVGMTNVPEVFLAREAQLAYATVGLVTDYDCWLEDPGAACQCVRYF
jgi:5'-methylthioadenosine phosphorylase